MQLFAIKLVSFKNKCIFQIVIFYVLLATSWFVITIPVLLSVLPPKVPRFIVAGEPDYSDLTFFFLIIFIEIFSRPIVCVNRHC